MNCTTTSHDRAVCRNPQEMAPGCRVWWSGAERRFLQLIYTDTDPDTDVTVQPSLEPNLWARIAFGLPSAASFGRTLFALGGGTHTSSRGTRAWPLSVVLALGELLACRRMSVPTGASTAVTGKDGGAKRTAPGKSKVSGRAADFRSSRDRVRHPSPVLSAQRPRPKAAEFPGPGAHSPCIERRAAQFESYGGTGKRYGGGCCSIKDTSQHVRRPRPAPVGHVTRHAMRSTIADTLEGRGAPGC